MKTLEEEFASYLAAVYPDGGVSDIQLRETRNAFYAGCATVFYGISTSVSDGDEVQESDVAMMERISAQLDAFSAESRKRARRYRWRS